MKPELAIAIYDQLRALGRWEDNLTKAAELVAAHDAEVEERVRRETLEEAAGYCEEVMGDWRDWHDYAKTLPQQRQCHGYSECAYAACELAVKFRALASQPAKVKP